MLQDQLDAIRWPASLLNVARNRKPGTVWGEAREASTPQDCPNCGGTGTMTAFVVDDAPPDGKGCLSFIAARNRMCYGYRMHAPCPVCAGDQRAAFLLRFCGLSDDDLAVRLDQFKPLAGKVNARQEAARLLSLTPEPTGFTTFYGAFGVGKSHLLKSLVNGFRVAGILAVYTRMADILAEVRETFGDQSRDSGEELIQRYGGYPVLAIDEVDRVNLTPWSSETLFRLLDSRYSRRARLLTVLATNADPHQGLGGLEYLASRMKDGTIIEVGGNDMRGVL
jgi:hypothetical protein